MPEFLDQKFSRMTQRPAMAKRMAQARGLAFANEMGKTAPISVDLPPGKKSRVATRRWFDVPQGLPDDAWYARAEKGLVGDRSLEARGIKNKILMAAWDSGYGYGSSGDRFYRDQMPGVLLLADHHGIKQKTMAEYQAGINEGKQERRMASLSDLALLDMALVEASIPGVALDRDMAALDLHARLAAIDVSANQQIGKTIIEQMGGMRAMKLIGAKRIIWLKDGVGVQWPNKQRSKGNYFEVRLTPADLYDLEFFSLTKRGKKLVKKLRGVAWDQLTSLFEKQTGWYLRMASGQSRVIASRGVMYLKIPLLGVAPSDMGRHIRAAKHFLGPDYDVSSRPTMGDIALLVVAGKSMSEDEWIDGIVPQAKGLIAALLKVGGKLDPSLFRNHNKALAQAARGRMGRMARTEQEATDLLEDLAGGSQQAFRMMNLWRRAHQAGSERDRRNGLVRPVEIFIKAARRERFSVQAIAHYVEEIQGRALPRGWKRLATFEEGSRIPDGWDSGHIDSEEEDDKLDEGSDTPDGNGNTAKRAAGLVQVGPVGMFRYHWPNVYLHGTVGRALNYKVLSFDKPLTQGTLQGQVISDKGSPVNVVIYAWVDAGVPAGLVVAKNDRAGLSEANAEAQGKMAHTAAQAKWIIMKGTRARKDFDANERDAYMGGAAQRAGVTPGKVYTNKDQAERDAKKIGEVNPVGFTVVRIASVKAYSGLYGHTKGVQADCEGCIRKVQKAAHRIAKTAYGKNPKVAEFLGRHAERSNSLPAHILVAALSDLGPKFASSRDSKLAMRLAELRSLRAEEKTATPGASSDQKFKRAVAPRGKAQVAIAAYVKGWKSGQSMNLSDIAKSLVGVNFAKIMSAAEQLKKKGLIDYDGVKVTKLASQTVKTAARQWKFKAYLEVEGDTKAAARRLKGSHQGEWGMIFVDKAHDDADGVEMEGRVDPDDGAKKSDIDEDLFNTLRDVVGRMSRTQVDDLKVKSLRRASEEIKMAATEGKVAHNQGLYGFSDKVARLGLTACSDIRAETGSIAYNLHRRRSAKHANITAFLDTHCKTTECRYSQLLAASYPSADSKVAALETPRTVAAWLAWED